MPQMEVLYINYCSLAFSGLISTQRTFTTGSEILVIVKASQAVERREQAFEIRGTMFGSKFDFAQADQNHSFPHTESNDYPI